MPDTCRWQVFERHRASGMCGVHRPTQKAVVVQPPHVREVTRLMADGHRCAALGRPRGSHLPQPLPGYAVAAYPAGRRHQHQHQGQLFPTVRHPRQPSVAKPGLDGGQAGCMMAAVVIAPQAIVPPGGIKLRQREPRGGGGVSLAERARECGATGCMHRPYAPRHFPPALRPTDATTRGTCRAAATCSRGGLVQSRP